MTTFFDRVIIISYTYLQILKLSERKRDKDGERERERARVVPAYQAPGIVEWKPETLKMGGGI